MGERGYRRGRAAAAWVWMLMLTLACACSRTKAPTPLEAPEAPEAPGPLLWQIEKDGKRSHVFATGPHGFSLQETSPLVWQAFGKSRSLVVVHGKRLPRPQDFNQRLRDPQAMRLSQRLGMADWRVLLREIHGLIGRIDRLEYFHPTIVAFILTTWGKPLKDATEHLIYQAEDRGIPITVLDPNRFTENTIIDAFGVRYLRMVLADVPKQRDAFEARARHYRNGNLAALTRIANEQTQQDCDDPRFWVRYYAQPSTTWLDRLTPALGSGGLFVAMDADAVLHRTGLLAGLRSRGYQITRLGAGTPASLPAGRVFRASVADCRRALDHHLTLELAALPPARRYTDHERKKLREHLRPRAINRCLSWTKTRLDCHMGAKTREAVRACSPKGCLWDKRGKPMKLICP